jgi:hypothetical protein
LREKCRRAAPRTEKADKPAQWTRCILDEKNTATRHHALISLISLHNERPIPYILWVLATRYTLGNRKERGNAQEIYVLNTILFLLLLLSSSSHSSSLLAIGMFPTSREHALWTNYRSSDPSMSSGFTI